MATPLFNFSGLASGLDTNAIVEGLMQVERAPITRLQISRAGYDRKLDAWTAITSKVSEFRTSVDALSSQSDFNKFVSAASSDEDALGVTVTGSPSPAAVNLTIMQLAATHQVATGTGYTSSSDAVGAGTFSITTASGTTDVSTSTSTTLLQLAQQINTADPGVHASIIQVSDTDHRLLLTADSSGGAASFTVSSDIAGFATNDVISDGVDATVLIGDPVNGLDITRSSNTFTNVIDGVTLDLKKAGTGTLTVEVSRDTEAAVAAITTMVNSANGALKEIADKTAYNAECDQASALTNDRAARDMALELQSLLSGTVTASNITHFGELGIEFTRAGNYSIDSAKLQEALETDFDDVVEFFVRAGTTDDTRLTYVSATGATAAGTYEVIATAAAEVPSITGSGYVPNATFQDMSIRFGGTTGVIGVSALSSLQAAVDQINDGLALIGLDDVLAEASGGAIKLSAPGFYGSAYDLEVWDDTAFGLNDLVTGSDVAGTIGGEAATGSGRTLTATAGDPIGLAALVGITTADLGGGPLTVGNVSLTQGIIGGVDGWLDLVEGIDGKISRARGEWDARIENIDDSIEAFEQRMIQREAQLRRQFTAMETALAGLQNQASFLAGFATPSQAN